MKRNPGHLPPEATGRRVRVVLNNGATFDAPADGRFACIWAITGSACDIAEYEVLT